ncbi:hypothetical protein D1632_05380 [Chryseobacterium nematophagum]|uniref:Antirepressor protein C-terminal domain-containing protein n=1 Tax=Chryseobacterium nematophagum TaxID=2305228 RepID=A0A3M7LCE1_9FLAO|nr:phage antirepressor KilAC domain-containing protein [Chryseobacterium nematophagum]RMZ60371.1 hypothetical protein D1632_05380 [Chryseobacterium nematophagum]
MKDTNIFMGDDIIYSKKLYSMEEAAKILNIKKMGRNNLLKALRERNVLDSLNYAHKEYENYLVSTRTEKSWPRYVTLVTPEGLLFLSRLLKGE